MLTLIRQLRSRPVSTNCSFLRYLFCKLAGSLRILNDIIETDWCLADFLSSCREANSQCPCALFAFREHSVSFCCGCFGVVVESASSWSQVLCLS